MGTGYLLRLRHCRRTRGCCRLCLHVFGAGRLPCLFSNVYLVTAKRCRRTLARLLATRRLTRKCSPRRGRVCAGVTKTCDHVGRPGVTFQCLSGLQRLVPRRGMALCRKRILLRGGGVARKVRILRACLRRRGRSVRSRFRMNLSCVRGRVCKGTTRRFRCVQRGDLPASRFRVEARTKLTCYTLVRGQRRSFLRRLGITYRVVPRDLGRGIKRCVPQRITPGSCCGCMLSRGGFPLRWDLFAGFVTWGRDEFCGEGSNLGT